MNQCLAPIIASNCSLREDENLQGCKEKDGDIGDDIGHAGANNIVLEVEALRFRYRLVPRGLHGLALKNNGEDDSNPPSHNKGNHAVAYYSEFAIDAENAQV